MVVNSLIAYLLPLFPKSFVKIFAKPYLAGETLEEALAEIRALNARGISATLDLLGEDPKTRSQCRAAVEMYLAALDRIAETRLNSGISLKPSHMGLKLDKTFCFDNIREVAGHAAERGIFVRIDMEDTALKNDTLDLFSRLKKEFGNVGIVVQAYLRSAIQDIKPLMDAKAGIRLCKGAYFWEHKKDAYKDPAVINSSYAYLLEQLLSHGCFVGIATHDETLVFEALKIIDRLGLGKEAYEFQMLYGVEAELRAILRDQGHPVRVYVPFGKEWLAYSIRRLKENPKMVSYIFSSLLKKTLNR
ncbi:MAG: proline dehydrogenase family protein [Desulfobacteraceae bacterium]|nr:proline dehydrogenase family protein [Desulfobacteraceae bacterium]